MIEITFEFGGGNVGIVIERIRLDAHPFSLIYRNSTSPFTFGGKIQSIDPSAWTAEQVRGTLLQHGFTKNCCSRLARCVMNTVQDEHTFSFKTIIVWRAKRIGHIASGLFFSSVCHARCEAESAQNGKQR